MTCPVCGADTLPMPDGRHLNPTRSLVGRYLPDGYELTPSQQRDSSIKGHMLHHCPEGVSSRDLEAVRKRHADIPQDPLPIEGLDLAELAAEPVEVRKEPRSERWAKCPHHEPDKRAKRQLTGLYQVGPDEWVFREHTKRIGKLTLTCPGSGSKYEPQGPDE